MAALYSGGYQITAYFRAQHGLGLCRSMNLNRKNSAEIALLQLRDL